MFYLQFTAYRLLFLFGLQAQSKNTSVFKQKASPEHEDVGGHMTALRK